MANTGNKVYATLLKVSDDVNEYPLDVNNNRTSVSGLPQASKANTVGTDGYIAPFASASCPTDTVVNYRVDLTLTGTNEVTAVLVDKSTGTPIEAPEDIFVYFAWASVSDSGSDILSILIGDTQTIYNFPVTGVNNADSAGKTSVATSPPTNPVTAIGGGTIE